MIIKLPVRNKEKSKIIQAPAKMRNTLLAEKREPAGEYSCLDACVCCGRYMPEGTGMVCEECMKSLQET